MFRKLNRLKNKADFARTFVKLFILWLAFVRRFMYNHATL